MRLIDADNLLTAFPPEEDETFHTSAVRGTINACPTVDAVPVVHGHWKEDPSGYGFWICSACGFVSEASAADMLYKFCPVCGAKMDGKDGEQNG